MTACTAVLDLDRAGAWCDRIAEFADRHGSRYMLAFCRAEYGAVHLLRGSWSQAEALLEAAVEDFSASRPAWVAAPLAGLAELRRRQGRADEAERLLGTAGGRRAMTCRARLALDRGETLRAAELAERLLRATPGERLLDRAPALELLAHARITRGELDRAAPALAALRAALAEVETPPFRAALDLVDGRYAGALADHDRARRLLEDAVDGYGRGGLPFETARARTELATLLVRTGRAADGARELAAARDAFVSLGAGTEATRVERLLGVYTRATGRTPGDGITRREREVLDLLADGLTSRQIAERLVVSEHTVHRHVTNILRKLDVPSRAAAAAYAVRLGLVDK